MLENPQVAKDLIYDYRGMKIRGTRNEAGWNTVYVVGKIIKKIGPILAINNKDFYRNYVAQKLINNVPRHYQNMEIKGIALDSRKVKKGYIFCY